MFNTMGWRGRTAIGTLVRITSDEDCRRVGSNWMRGRLKVDDVLLCVQHTGDCFYDYILVSVAGNGLQGVPGVRFGAYELGEPLQWQPSLEEAALLQAGTFIQTTAVTDELDKVAAQERLKRAESVQSLRPNSVIQVGEVYRPEVQKVAGKIGIVVDNDLAKDDKPGLLAKFQDELVFLPKTIMNQVTVLQM
jgi:hypothetical protein